MRKVDAIKRLEMLEELVMKKIAEIKNEIKKTKNNDVNKKINEIDDLIINLEKTF